jgi:hypothetical protein
MKPKFFAMNVAMACTRTSKQQSMQPKLMAYKANIAVVNEDPKMKLMKPVRNMRTTPMTFAIRI